MIGLYVKNGNELWFNDTKITASSGGMGIHVRPNRDLYFNDTKIATGNTASPIGLYTKDGVLYFDGNKVGTTTDTPDVVQIGEFSTEGYWIPPSQPANTAAKMWTYSQIIAKYDELVAVEPNLKKYRYNDASGKAILTPNGSYELYHYVYTPANYDKTIYLQAAIHGNEKDSRFTLYRMMQILFTMRNQTGYTAWQQIYNRCRLIIIPVVNPYGNDNATMNVPFTGAQYGINPNRNMDYNQQYSIPSVGVGGNYPFQVVETQHIRDVIEKYGAKTIDYAVDYHDGEDVIHHYWISYAVDAPNRDLVNNFVQYMLKKHGVAPADAKIAECKDNPATGTVAGWFFKSLGVTASTNEWIGGIWGYTFDSAHLTHSLEIRSNMLFIALNNDVKGWSVKEPPNADFFHFDYPKAFTRDGIRQDAADAETIVTNAKIFARWDKLQTKHPTLIAKSASLGVNATNDNIHSYTFGNGSKKVLFVGGVMRYGASRKIDEFAIYQLIEYLCSDHITTQSKFLTDLRNNYKIIVLPFIDNVAGNEPPYTGAGLNNAALSRQRWVIDSATNKTVPANTEHGIQNYGVQIIKSLIDSNPDLKCIISGGEDTTGYGLNDQAEYATDFQTHFVVPKNMVFDKSAYANHLSTDRREKVVVQNTKGLTFGDYAYDQYGIKTYFVQLKVSSRFTELSASHTLSEQQYLHSNYEAGRRFANIVNLFVL